MTNVLLLYDAFIASVRLCAYEQLECLRDLGKIRFQHSDIKKVTSYQCKNADVIIFVRASTLLEQMLYKTLLRNHKFIIYVLDDDLLNIGTNLESTQYYSMADVKKRISYMISHCNVLVSPSQRLLYKYGKNVRTYKIEEPCDFAKNKKKNNTKIKIGFAGSTDHNEEINILLHNVIKTIHSKYSNQVEFEFVGAKPIIVNELKLVHYNYLDNYNAYQKLMENLNWDIGLAPLADTEFNKGKHYNKYIEYGSVSCVGIYSQVEPYIRIIEDNYNGYLCENTEEAWIKKLEYIIKYKDEIKKIRGNISSHLLQNFKVETISEKFIEDIPEIILYNSTKRGCYPIKFYHIYGLYIRYIEFVKRNGFKSLILTFGKLEKYLRKN